MSTDLYYRLPSKKYHLCHGLKCILARGYWGHDGSLTGDWITLDESDIGFLLDIVTKEIGEVVQDARKLIGLIEKDGSIEICISE